MRNTSVWLLPWVLLIGSTAAAGIPAELQGNWHPCAGDFGEHTNAANEEMGVGKIDFEVKQRSGSAPEYYLNVLDSWTHNLQDLTWHMVRGKDGAMKQPQLSVSDMCQKKFPELVDQEGDYTYMIGIADLSSRTDDGQYCGPTPHLIKFFPIKVGPDEKDYFVLTVRHLGNECAPSPGHPAPGNPADLSPYRALELQTVLMHNGVVHGHP